MTAFENPRIATATPGPLSKNMIQELDAVFDARAVHFVVDYEQSKDNLSVFVNDERSLPMGS